MLDRIAALAGAAAVLDHNETDRWYTADELMADYVSAKEAVWYPKNARLIAACNPTTILALVEVAKAAKALDTALQTKEFVSVERHALSAALKSVEPGQA